MTARATEIAIDGSRKSGSGTVVRTAVALATLLGRDLHLYNIRARREKPGLAHQHLAAIQAVRDVCGGALDGATVGSREIRFRPGPTVRGGKYRWEIGTAGSTTMLALSILPVAAYASAPSSFRIEGGLFQDFAPSFFHLQHVLLPTLRRMGLYAEARMVRPGYVPRGGGVIELQVQPVRQALRPLALTERRGRPRLWGVALSSRLAERRDGGPPPCRPGHYLRRAGRGRQRVCYPRRDRPRGGESMAGGALAGGPEPIGGPALLH